MNALLELTRDIYGETLGERRARIAHDRMFAREIIAIADREVRERGRCETCRQIVYRSPTVSD